LLVGEQAGAVGEVVTAVDALALELVQAGLQVLGRQKDDRLDARKRFPDFELLGRSLQLGLEFLGLQIGEVQRVLDRPGLVGVAEHPGRAVVGGGAGMGLDLDQEQAAGGRDQEVDFADVAAGSGEGEGLPGAVGLGVRHLRLDVLKGRLFPGVGGALALPSLRLCGQLHGLLA
jgi:hypothetical protein